MLASAVGNGAMARRRPGAVRRVSTSPAAVQRVGGAKVGVKIAPTAAADHADAVAALRTVVARLKEDVRREKADAAAAFRGRERDVAAQTAYARALEGAGFDLARLRRWINREPGLQVGEDDVVRTRAREGAPSVVIGYLLPTAAAYEPAAAPTGNVVAPTFKRWTPAGLSEKDYIEVAGRKLRRFAYRGITPAEIPQIVGGGVVKPFYSEREDRRAGRAGLSYDRGLGYYRDATKEDLRYLRGFADVEKIKKDVYAFAQARRGAGKFFSLTSTPKEITSNHGAGFTDFGRIKVDLAQVEPAHFVFHYAGGGAAAFSSGIPQRQVTDAVRHAAELDRARQSLIRNREIILTQYPAAAVTWERAPVEAREGLFDRGREDAMRSREAAYVPPDGRDDYQRGLRRGIENLRDRGRDDGRRDGKEGRDRRYNHRGRYYEEAYDRAYWFALGYREGFDDADRGRRRLDTRNRRERYADGYDRGFADAEQEAERRSRDKRPHEDDSDDERRRSGSPPRKRRRADEPVAQAHRGTGHQ